MKKDCKHKYVYMNDGWFNKWSPKIKYYYFYCNLCLEGVLKSSYELFPSLKELDETEEKGR